MKDEDYFRAKSLLENIDSLTKSTDEFKKIQESVKKNFRSATLYVHADGRTEELTLSKRITEIVLSEAIKSCNNSVIESKDKLDKTIDNSIADSSDQNDREGEQRNVKTSTAL